MKTRKYRGRTLYQVADKYVASGQRVWVFLPSSGMPVPKIFHREMNKYSFYAYVSRPQIHPTDAVNWCRARSWEMFASFDACCRANGLSPKLARRAAAHGIKVGIGIGRLR